MVIKGVLGGEGGILRSLRSSGFENTFVLEDGAPSHRAAVAKAARAEMGIDTLNHPPSSPDLNVIEDIWYLLKTGSWLSPESLRRLMSSGSKYTKRGMR